MALLKVKIIPEEIVAPYDLTKKLSSILVMLQSASYEITRKVTAMKSGGMIPNRFMIIED